VVRRNYAQGSLLEAASPATKLRVLEQVLIARAVRPLVSVPYPPTAGAISSNHSATRVAMMSMTTERINTVTSMYPRLIVADAARAIDFYVSALGAVETARHTDDNDKIIHSELKLDSVMFAVKDEDAGDPSPTTLGGSPVILALDVTDADAVGEAMVAAGATVIYPIRDWEYGARAGRLADPFGHLWMISQPLPSSTS
jgi:PhnB protein